MSALPEIDSVADLNSDKEALIAAFATSKGERVNQHFGSSQGFYTFRITPQGGELIATKAFVKEAQDGNEDKLKPKLSWLHGCDLVYVGSIGGSATKQLLMLGITPIAVKGAPAIEDLVESLRQELNGPLSPMLERVMKQKTGKSDSRFDEMDDEGWDE